MKTVELIDGHARGRREVPEGAKELNLAVDSGDRFGAWVVYRPTGEFNAEGLELWALFVPDAWAETGLSELSDL